MREPYDLVVIGAGPGGYVPAIKAAQLGLRVAVVERGDVGGTCLNRGCIPTKALLHAARTYRELRESAELGIFAENVSYDLVKMHARKDEVVQQLRGGIEFLLQSYKTKLELLRGKAIIRAADTVVLQNGDETETLKTKNILIATGSAPARPPIPGLELPGVYTSDDLLARADLDFKRLVIIGGGVIGVEFASVYASLGIEVTIVEAAERILPIMDREIAQNLQMILKKRGVNVFAGASVSRVGQTDGGLICHFTQKGAEHSLEADAVLVAVGRKARVDGLFADGFTVQTERGIVVSESFQTSVPGVYAVGDVIHGGIQLAHAASAQGCNAVAHMAGTEPVYDLSVIPSCIYTDPEIACAGLTAEQAKAAGIAVKTGKFNMSALGRSVIEAQERSFAKLVFDAESGVVLGAQLMCARATDLIGELAAAIVNKLTVEQLGAFVRPHPSFTEGIGEAIEDAEGGAVHAAPKRVL